MQLGNIYSDTEQTTKARVNNIADFIQHSYSANLTLQRYAGNTNIGTTLTTFSTLYKIEA